MKWLKTIVLFNQGDIVHSVDWSNLHQSYVSAIRSIDHPRGSGSLTIRKKIQLPNGQWKRNGVVYLKKAFLASMRDHGDWEAESDVPLPKDREQPSLSLYPSLEKYQEPITSNFGGFDFMAESDGGTRVAIEWETGNISSSHRSMNKLAIALQSGIMDVGVLIVPSNALYKHLTDRVGNIGELSGYLAMWAGMGKSVERGLLAISVVEHDQLTEDEAINFLRSGDDGNAKKGKSKLK